MAIPDRANVGDYYYHTYDYPGSVAFEAKGEYTEAQLNAWLLAAGWPGGAVPAAAYTDDEQAPYKRRGFVGQKQLLRKRRVRRTRAHGSENTGLERYSLVKDMEELQRNAANVHLDASLWYANSTTYFGRRIYVLKFGAPDAAPNPPQVLLTGGVHGREWIAVEIPYLIAEYLIKNYDHTAAAPAAAAAPSPGYAIRQLLESCQIWVIPLLNPDGHCWSLVSERLWRRNRKRHSLTDAQVRALHNPPVKQTISTDEGEVGVRPGGAGDWVFTGVDCNRNFDAAHPETDPRKETFARIGAVSEQERLALENCVAGNLTRVLPAAGGAAPALNRLCGSIDYHSARGAIMYHEGLALAPGLNDVRVAGTCMRDHVIRYADPNSNYAFDSVRNLLDPLNTNPKTESAGSVMDYCYRQIAAANPKLAFAIELDPVRPVPPGNFDQQRDRWSLRQSDIRRVFEKNLTPALCLIRRAIFGGSPAAFPFGIARGAAGNVFGAYPCPFGAGPAGNDMANGVKNRGNRLPA